MDGRHGGHLGRGVIGHTSLLLGLLALTAASAGAQGSRTATPAPTRNVVINKVRLSDAEVSGLEVQFRTQIRDGNYWYDSRSGAWGLEGGPAAGLIPAGLQLGGPLQPDASKGNTGVFINGRELHPLDVMALQQLGPVYPGRYWMDAMGNVGFDGGPALVNLWALVRARQGSGQAQSHYTRDGSMMTGTDGNGCYVFNDADSHTSWASNSC